jgi:plasmid stabilization system protein ParE
LYNYRIVYRLHGERVQIVAIPHGARLLASDLLSEDG